MRLVLNAVEIIPGKQQAHPQMQSMCFEEKICRKMRLMSQSLAAWSKNKEKQTCITDLERNMQTTD